MKSKGTNTTQGSAILATLRLLALVAITPGFFIAQQIAGLVLRNESARLRFNARCSRVWSRLSLAIMGVRVRIEGAPPTAPTLVAPNHLGYMDVAALSVAAPMFFVPKLDVLSWPVVGYLVKQSGHIFVKRARTRQLVETSKAIGNRLASGHSVCVFLEGTSTGGDRVLPFMPSLLDGAIKAGVPVMPVGLQWRSTNPEASVADHLAFWKKDTAFHHHFWRLLGLSGFEVTLRFGNAYQPSESVNRKMIARELWDRVSVLSQIEDHRIEPRAEVQHIITA